MASVSELFKVQDCDLTVSITAAFDNTSDANATLVPAENFEVELTLASSIFCKH